MTLHPPETQQWGHEVLPESGRTSAGYRLYDRKAVARARLLGTLRELGIELAEVGEPADRAALAERLTTFTDRRVGRYWALVGTINGWPPIPDVIPAWEWFAAALGADPSPTRAGKAA